jgi:hypothetical protein
MKITKNDTEELLREHTIVAGPPAKPIFVNGKRSSDTYPFTVHMALTKGELLALRHALEAYGEQSAVGHDVHCYLLGALQRIQNDLGEPIVWPEQRV